MLSCAVISILDTTANKHKDNITKIQKLRTEMEDELHMMERKLAAHHCRGGEITGSTCRPTIDSSSHCGGGAAQTTPRGRNRK